MPKRRKTKKQKLKSKKDEDVQGEDLLMYSLPVVGDEDSGEKRKKRTKSPTKTNDRLSLVYPMIIRDTRFSIFVSIAILILYALIYYLM